MNVAAKKLSAITTQYVDCFSDALDLELKIGVARLYCNVWHFGELQIKPQPTKIQKHSRASKTNYFLSPYFSKITKLWENWFKEFRYVCHSTGLTYGNF